MYRSSRNEISDAPHALVSLSKIVDSSHTDGKLKTAWQRGMGNWVGKGDRKIRGGKKSKVIMLRCQGLAKSPSTLRSGIRSIISSCTASAEGSGKNIAQGDTVRESGGREVANAAKGDELAKGDNLEYVTIQHGAQAFKGDLRSTSALGLGDGLYTHTDKWNEVRASTENTGVTKAAPVSRRLVEFMMCGAGDLG